MTSDSSKTSDDIIRDLLSSLGNAPVKCNEKDKDTNLLRLFSSEAKDSADGNSKENGTEENSQNFIVDNVTETQQPADREKKRCSSTSEVGNDGLSKRKRSESVEKTHSKSNDKKHQSKYEDESCEQISRKSKSKDRNDKSKSREKDSHKNSRSRSKRLDSRSISQERISRKKKSKSPPPKHEKKVDPLDVWKARKLAEAKKALGQPEKTVNDVNQMVLSIPLPTASENNKDDVKLNEQKSENENTPPDTNPLSLGNIPLPNTDGNEDQKINKEMEVKENKPLNKEIGDENAIKNEEKLVPSNGLPFSGEKNMKSKGIKFASLKDSITLSVAAAEMNKKTDCEEEISVKKEEIPDTVKEVEEVVELIDLKTEDKYTKKSKKDKKSKKSRHKDEEKSCDSDADTCDEKGDEYRKRKHKRHKSDSKKDRRKRSHRSPSEDRIRRSGDKSHKNKSKDRSRRSRDRSHKSRDRSPRSRDRSRKSRDRSRGSKDRSRRKRDRSESYDTKDGDEFSASRKRAHQESSVDCVKALKDKMTRKRLFDIARRNAVQMVSNGQSVPLKAVHGKSVQDLTNFCKQLAQTEDFSDCEDVLVDENGRQTSDSLQMRDEAAFNYTGRHPFISKDKPIMMNIRNAPMLPTKTNAERLVENCKLREQFPVSSGSHHRDKDSAGDDGWVPVEQSETRQQQSKALVPYDSGAVESEKVFPVVDESSLNFDLSELVSERLSAMRKLQENPMDSEAKSKLSSAQQNMSNWALSKQEPGKFTGSTGVKVLSYTELCSGQQAWAKKEQLKTATPVSSHFGLKMMQKMGWNPGEGLGKNKEGQLTPLMLDVKMDKKGFHAQEELASNKQSVPTSKSLAGKHPVSALVELCGKRRWKAPNFEIICNTGPDHKKNYIMKAIVNGKEYKPSYSSPTKKLAKAVAAAACLVALGIIPPEGAPSANSEVLSTTSQMPQNTFPSADVPSKKGAFMGSKAYAKNAAYMAQHSQIGPPLHNVTQFAEDILPPERMASTPVEAFPPPTQAMSMPKRMPFNRSFGGGRPMPLMANQRMPNTFSRTNASQISGPVMNNFATSLSVLSSYLPEKAPPPPPPPTK